MAQDFFLQRVLATEVRSGFYGRGSMCVLQEKDQPGHAQRRLLHASPLHGANQSTERWTTFRHGSSDLVRNAG